MSLWYDIKKKSYASDAKDNWIKSYVDKMLSELKTWFNTTFEAHYIGEEGRHSATDVVCSDGSSVQTALDNEAAARLQADAAIRQEVSLEDSAIREEINKEATTRTIEDEKLGERVVAEETARVDADNKLQSNIDAEIENREAALALKVDKEEGKGLSANDYTDAEKSRLSQVEAGARKNADDIASIQNRTVKNENDIAALPIKSGTGVSSAVINSPNNTASGDYSGAQGRITKALGEASMAEGYLTIAQGRFSHAQNQCSEAYGQSSHAGGLRTIVHSHTGFAHGRDVMVEEAAAQATGFGNGTIVTTPQSFVTGSYNLEDTNEDADTQYVHIVGNGTIDNRSNAYTLDRQGNAWFAGKVTSGDNKDELVTKDYVDGLVSDAGGGDMLKTVYDQNGNGVVDDAEKLGGQLPSYYATKTEVDGKAPRSHLSSSTTYGAGSATAYGHVRLANNLTTTTVTGYALAANQGKVLDDKIAELASSLSTPPTLTSVTPDGTKIGDAAWTGTGWVCTDTDTKYTFNNTYITIVSGFNRFCLKLANGSKEWKNWTPFFEYDGQSYEFFYSPSRDLYEALIPANTMTAAEVVAAIEWEKIPPTILNYGKISNGFGHYETVTTASDGTTTSEHRYFFRRECDCRDTSGVVNQEDVYSQQGLAVGKYLLAAGDIDINCAAIMVLAADVNMIGNINGTTATRTVMNGTNKNFKVENIDNFS